MSSTAKLLADHKLWLEYANPHGLVVAAALLADRNLALQRDVDAVRSRLRALALPEGKAGKRFDRERLVDLQVDDFAQLAAAVLDWPLELLAGSPQGPTLPDSLRVVVTGFAEELLAPTHAVPRLPDGQPPDYEHPYLLVKQLPQGAGFDRVLEPAARGWSASPHDKFLYLLRERKVQLGLLFNGRTLRLLVAPRAQTPAWIDFELAHLCEPDPEPLAGLRCLLARERVFPSAVKRLLGLEELVVASRRYQAKVSIELADQVLEALWELLRGFVAADRRADPPLFGDGIHTRQAREELYGGLLTVIMRLVFLLYAEDQDLMPASPVYQRSYSVGGLFEQLRADHAQWPDTMDQRYGAWARLLALFRLVHGGGGRGRGFELPARAGQLFDPERHRFLEGHLPTKEKLEWRIPTVSDGAILRVLERLLYLKGERISYGTLDVEQIGSVYENMMGYAIEVAKGRTLALGKTHVVVDLDALLALAPGKRAEHLAKLGIEAGKAVDAGLRSAKSYEALVDALVPRRSRFTPEPLPALTPYLQPSEERRRSGSHYTPRELTEPIVATTLDPRIAALGDAPTAAQLLELKICDPAMGSGAFLVAACRYLAERIAGAWERHGDRPAIPPDEQRGNLHAMRLVATRCLYGVDKNPFAVDLAKLSLWLVTLAKQHPFTFVDHALRHGDSLVGLTRMQIAGVTWKHDNEDDLPLSRYMTQSLAKVTNLRMHIHELGDEGEAEKRSTWRDIENELEDPRLVGDAVIATFFAHEKTKQRELALAQLRTDVQEWRTMGDRNIVGGLRALQEQLRGGDNPIPPFHWEIEFPEVFDRFHAGFDAIIGNPPFLGGTQISTALGKSYTRFLTTCWHHSGDRTDLVAYFFRASFEFINNEGTLGFIATNTVAQGDTRVSGLHQIATSGGQIYAAVKRTRWPGKAAVIASQIHIAKTPVNLEIVLNGERVAHISSFLFANNHEAPPKTLPHHTYCSKGVDHNGDGFILEVDSPLAHQGITKPFLGGKDLNTSPKHVPSRMIIDLGMHSIERAREIAPDHVAHLERTVRVQRAKKSAEIASSDWWRFWRTRDELFRQIKARALAYVTVATRVQPHWTLARVPSNFVYSDSIAIFVDDRFAFFAILQSRVHEIWARFFGSSMKDDLRYTPTDCFETFPFPPDWAENAALEQAGREYYEARARWMVEHGEGLTATYNRFHDPAEQAPEILALRALHAAMDRAVLDAYGWTEIATTCEFQLDYEDEDDEPLLGPADRAPKRVKKKPWRLRWPDAIHDEVLGKLLECNVVLATAAATPAAASGSAKTATAKKASAKTSSAKKTSAKKTSAKKTSAKTSSAKKTSAKTSSTAAAAPPEPEQTHFNLSEKQKP